MYAKLTTTLAAVIVAVAVGWTQIGVARSAEEYTDTKLTAFVTAVGKVQDVVALWDPKIKQADTEEKAAEMIKSAREDIVKAVDDTPDITVDEYNAIVQEAGADTTLASRIDEMLKASRTE